MGWGGRKSGGQGHAGASGLVGGCPGCPHLPSVVPSLWGVQGAGSSVEDRGGGDATSPISAGKEVRSAVWVLRIVRRDPGT